MEYRVIGLMSGSSLDGLDIVFAVFQENGGKWNFEISEAACYPYPDEWIGHLKAATELSAVEYQLLHTSYGHYLGEQVNKFIDETGLQYKVALVASHGHTTFHLPSKKMTAQLGDGAAIASEVQLPVVSDLRSMDIAFGGQGAPIVPIGEKLLLGKYDYFLNLGGIANVSISGDKFIAFDVCAANRVLNMLANDMGHEFDRDGAIARTGNVNPQLLDKLNSLDYYVRDYPKSLANDFGTDTIYPLIKTQGLSANDELRTYTEHIAVQVRLAILKCGVDAKPDPDSYRDRNAKLLATGGGAFNKFLIECLSKQMKELNIEVVVPDDGLVKFKEALIMALIGVLRWREEYNVLSTVTGARRASIGGALWLGQEA